MIQSLSFPSYPTLINTSTSSFRCRAAVATPPPPTSQVPAARKATPGSLYEVLRVNKNASVGEIKAAYRSLAKLYHPDAATSSLTAQSDGCDFIQIHNAYETLSDPATRALYDLTLNLGSNMTFRGYSCSGQRRPIRRWETDQCW